MLALSQTEKHYLTQENDILDRIAWNFYGRTQGTTEKVLRRNASVLTRFSALLPAGILIVLPVIEQATTSVIKLWNYKPEQVYVPVVKSQVETLDEVRAALHGYRLSRRTT